MYHMRANHCYTIITDQMFQHIFTVKMMHELSISSYLVILVADYEDMLEPNERIVRCLLEAQRSGCDAYLIFLANGIQAERLMRFIDRSVWSRKIRYMVYSMPNRSKNMYNFSIYHCYKKFTNMHTFLI